MFAAAGGFLAIVLGAFFVLRPDVVADFQLKGSPPARPGRWTPSRGVIIVWNRIAGVVCVIAGVVIPVLVAVDVLGSGS